MSVEELGEHLPKAAIEHFEEENISLNLQKCQWQITESPRGTDEELVIYGNTLVWANAGVLKKSFCYEEEGQELLLGLFAHFKSSDRINYHNPGINNFGLSTKSYGSLGRERQATSEKVKRALVIFLADEANIYYEDGPFDIINMPFRLEKAHPISNGLLLKASKDGANKAMPIYFVMLDPIVELGIAVSWESNEEISEEEDFIFLLDHKPFLAVSYHKEHRSISLWSYQTESNTKVVERRKSSRRRSSIGTSSFLGSEFETQGDKTLNLRKNTFGDMNQLNDFPTNSEDFCKLCFFRLLDSFSWENIDTTKAFSLTPEYGCCMLGIFNRDIDTLLLFEYRFDVASLPVFQDKYIINCKDVAPISDGSFHRLLLLDTNGNLRLEAPWLSRASTQLTQKCEKLVYPAGNRVSLVNKDGKLLRIAIDLKPMRDLVGECLKVCLCVLQPDLFDIFFNTYLQILRRDSEHDNDWDAFQVALILLFRGNRSTTHFTVPDTNSLQTSIDEFRDELNTQGWRWVIEGVSEGNYSQVQLLRKSQHFETKQDFAIFGNASPYVLLGLHLLCEDFKLDVFKAPWCLQMAPCLAQTALWMGWTELAESYINSDLVVMDYVLDYKPLPLGFIAPPEEMPSIYKWLERCLKRGKPSSYMNLVDLATEARSSMSLHLIKECERVLRKTMVIKRIYACLVSPSASYADVVTVMVEAGFVKSDLESLPEGIAIPLREVIANTQAHPPTTWDHETLHLVGREDLVQLLKGDKDVVASLDYLTKGIPKESNYTAHVAHDQSSLVWDDLVGSERLSLSRLIFREDRRLQEVIRLLQSSRAVRVRQEVSEALNDHEIVARQQFLAQHIAIRTLATSVGRALLWLRACYPLLTEKFPIQGFNFAIQVQPANVTVAVEKQFLSEERTSWGLFHNGAASALSIAVDSQIIDSSWIVFNKPPDLNARHAGFLLGLGLNGHLRKLASWHVSNYLTPRHAMTSVGILLGLSAGYIGTMDTTIVKLLSVHVVALLPSGSSELNLSNLTQTASVLGVGLLYFETQHRRMSDIMVSEVECIDSQTSHVPTDTLRDEGYRLSAGFALGLINLGKGEQLEGLQDLRIPERLMTLITKPKDIEIAHVLDKIAPGATIAITLMFLKTNNTEVAKNVRVPNGSYQTDYIRPDVLLLRTLAYNLIMWDSISSGMEWIAMCIPHFLRQDVTFGRKRKLNTDDLALYHIVAGACFSMALRYAGTAHTSARDSTLAYLDAFMQLCNLSTTTYDERLARDGVRNCQDVVCLSAATIMAGTGDLEVLRRLRMLHGRTTSFTTYGSHMAVHMAIGVLFMGGGLLTFGRSNMAIASLLLAFYPLFPNSVSDSSAHLQAFRHFWILATEARCLVLREVQTQSACIVPINVTLRSGREISKTAPCLLPDLDQILRIETNSQDYWHVVLDFANNPRHLQAFLETQTLYVFRRSASHSTKRPFERRLQTITESRTTDKWLLPRILRGTIFEDFDKSELAGVVPEESEQRLTRPQGSTIIDTKLTFMHFVNSSNADDIWNLRLLFTFYDILGPDQEAIYLSRDFVDVLRMKLKAADK